MQINTFYATKNDCYRANIPLTPTGVMIHSTGANNPKLSRYVQPIGYSPVSPILGENKNRNDWCNNAKAEGVQMCCHAFIGQCADGKIGVAQILPWKVRGWHCGLGSKGSANTTHIGIEICEDSLSSNVYFKQTYDTAVALTAYLCSVFEIAVSDKSIISHNEGAKAGLASNHGDPDHWWCKYKTTMDDFRRDVLKSIPIKPGKSMDIYKVQIGAFSAQANAHSLLIKAKDAGYADAYIFKDGFYKVQIGAYTSLQHAIEVKEAAIEKGFSACISVVPTIIT